MRHFERYDRSYRGHRWCTLWHEFNTSFPWVLCRSGDPMDLYFSRLVDALGDIALVVKGAQFP